MATENMPQDTAGLRDRYQQRWSSLKLERTSWDGHWRELAQFLLPRGARFFEHDRNKGWKRDRSIYDNSGHQAVNVLAAGLMGGMTSPARPWFRLATADRDLMDYGPVKTWLALVQVKMLQVFAQSNFYRGMHTIYRQLGVFGTGVTLIDRNYNDVIRLQPLLPGRYAIAQDETGQVNTLYREVSRTVGQMVQQFGKEQCSPALQGLFERGNLDAWVKLIHVIEPRADRDLRSQTAKNMPWRSVYFDPADDKSRILSEGGFKRFRALAGRWDLEGEDIYGTSPGMVALNDAMSLQTQQYRKHQAIDYQVRPPIYMPTAMKDRERDMMPGGTTYIDSIANAQPVRSMWEVRTDLSHLRESIIDTRHLIDTAFHKDLFLMLANQTDARMTATEVAERHQEKLLMLGPVLERMHNEVLDPAVEGAFEDLMEAGALPPPPKELEGVTLDVEFVSMLAQAQRAVQTNGIDRFISNALAIGQVKPEVLDRIDVDSWAETYSDMLGVDPSLVTPREQAEQVRAARAQAMAAAQKAEQMNMAADSAAKLGNAQVEGGSALDALTSATDQFSGY